MHPGRNPTANGAISDLVPSILLSNVGFWPPTVIALLLVCHLSLHLCLKKEKNFSPTSLYSCFVSYKINEMLVKFYPKKGELFFTCQFSSNKSSALQNSLDVY